MQNNAEQNFTGDILLSEPDVEVAAFAGTGDVLAVFFTSWHPSKKFDPEVSYLQVKRLRGEAGRHVIKIEDKEWNWLGRPGLSENLAKIIQEYRQKHNINRVIAYGGSGGASKAMDMCSRIDFWGVFALAPQIDFGAAFRSFDRRRAAFSEWMKPGYVLPHPGHAFASDAKIVLYHGIRRGDASHAAMCPARAGVYHYLYPDLEHGLSDRMHLHNTVSRSFEAFCQDDMDLVEQLAIQSGAIRRGNLDYTMPDPPWTEAPAPPRHAKAS